MAEIPKFNVIELVSRLDLSHLHPAEQHRIRTGAVNSQELGLLLGGQNPWTVSGKPKPLNLVEGTGPSLEQILPLMHASTRQALPDMSHQQREQIIEFYKRQLKEGSQNPARFPEQPEKASLISQDASSKDGNTETIDAVDIGRTRIRHVKYTFLDVVGFSERDPASQAYIVRTLNEIVLSAIDANMVGDRYLFLPTGDGMCIAFLGHDHDVHLRVALTLLRLIEEHNSQEGLTDTTRFQVRIGLNQGSDILVDDINGRENLAGATINMAARVMGLAGAGQIIVGPMVYADLDSWQDYRGKFHEFTATVKHGKSIKAVQIRR